MIAGENFCRFSSYFYEIGTNLLPYRLHNPSWQDRQGQIPCPSRITDFVIFDSDNNNAACAITHPGWCSLQKRPLLHLVKF